MFKKKRKIPPVIEDPNRQYAIRKIETGKWFCYCHTTGEPLLRSGDPRKVNAEIFSSIKRAEQEIEHGIHPFFTLKRERFEIVAI